MSEVILSRQRCPKKSRRSTRDCGYYSSAGGPSGGNFTGYYRPYDVYLNVHKVLYVQVLKDIYGILVASLLWCKIFSSDINK